MREILFRGKRKDNGEWVYGHLIDGDDVTLIIPKHKEFTLDEGYIEGMEAVEVLPETICEFTGLTDKNGNKIFEDDIVKCYRYANEKDGELVFENLVVVWDDMNACFALAEVGMGHISYRYNEYEMDDTHEFKVIGNIYDNSEL